MPAETTWTGSLHQTFRLLGGVSPTLSTFLESDGLTADEILTRLPYSVARAQARGAAGTSGPDPKRYRDPRQVYQTAGLVYEDAEKRLHVTALGQATRRWIPILNLNNSVILARHAAYALSACQLRNPTGAGRKYVTEMTVFPFQFIWRAMLKLGGKINSEELNRAVFRVKNEAELEAAIDRIAAARRSGALEEMGDEIITGAAKNDRIIPWVSLASFGWTLFPDKRAGADGYYELPQRTLSIIKEAAQLRHRPREFTSVEAYIEYISRAACLPDDVR